ncbi:MAG: hypothetical protein E7354_04570 [Clostridiales bacterium]|nr:hypothetical protein [Clostridiales bacterium]
MAERKDYSQELYREFLDSVDTEFMADTQSQFLLNYFSANRLYIKGVIADGAMLFTNDQNIYNKVMWSEKQRCAMANESDDYMDPDACVGSVLDYGVIAQRGFSLPAELPMPFDNVLLISEADVRGSDGRMSRGRKTMVFSHDTARLKDFTHILSQTMSESNRGERAIDISASFENNRVEVQGDNLSQVGYLDSVINEWIKANPDLVK